MDKGLVEALVEADGVTGRSLGCPSVRTGALVSDSAPKTGELKEDRTKVPAIAYRLIFSETGLVFISLFL
ncbi:hypothetical protein MPNT_80024 [Candidatus Methylacidithermus pantelleriae]|uniref:Uncharacterized protein n=1 Tax=Candidatus Methylacidithermus pantelleriae TaxID=2744239 RepID=A0A8J2FTH9_9BACT|nr:hypothetical protein MPNT_80024 [Candidatus Methylacidithermus pantelleriae]